MILHLDLEAGIFDYNNYSKLPRRYFFKVKVEVSDFEVLLLAEDFGALEITACRAISLRVDIVSTK